MRRVHWLAILLVISLAGNVFAVAYGVTSAVRSPALGLLQPNPTAVASRLAKLLPPTAATALETRMANAAPRLAEQSEAYQSALTEAAVLLNAAELDQIAFAASIEKGRLARTAIGDILTDTLVATIAALPTPERRALVARFMQQ